MDIKEEQKKGSVSTVEFLLTDTSLIRIVSYVAKKPHIFFKKIVVYGTDPLKYGKPKLVTEIL